jgi:hypothetical protein
MYALMLNDMRSSNVENIEVVRTGQTSEELADWYRDQLAPEPWNDGRWNKAFKAGSDLEWYNPATSIDVLNDFWGGIYDNVPDWVPLGYALVKGH